MKYKIDKKNYLLEVSAQLHLYSNLSQYDQFNLQADEKEAFAQNFLALYSLDILVFPLSSIEPLHFYLPNQIFSVDENSCGPPLEEIEDLFKDDAIVKHIEKHIHLKSL